MDLSDIGMQKHRSAASAAVVHGVSASEEDRRRAYGPATFGQLNDGEIFTFAGTHLGKDRRRRDNDLCRWAHNQNRLHLSLCSESALSRSMPWGCSETLSEKTRERRR